MPTLMFVSALHNLCYRHTSTLLSSYFCSASHTSTLLSLYFCSYLHASTTSNMSMGSICLLYNCVLKLTAWHARVRHRRASARTSLSGCVTCARASALTAGVLTLCVAGQGTLQSSKCCGSSSIGARGATCIQFTYAVWAQHI